VEDELFEASLASVKDRRRLLLALVRNEGWDWDALWPTAEQQQERKPLFPPATAGV
jgi:hypothetical protein